MRTPVRAPVTGCGGSVVHEVYGSASTLDQRLVPSDIPGPEPVQLRDVLPIFAGVLAVALVSLLSPQHSGIATVLCILLAARSGRARRQIDGAAARVRLDAGRIAVRQGGREDEVRLDAPFEVRIERMPLGGSATVVLWEIAAPGRAPLRFVHPEGEPFRVPTDALAGREVAWRIVWGGPEILARVERIAAERGMPVRPVGSLEP